MSRWLSGARVAPPWLVQALHLAAAGDPAAIAWAQTAFREERRERGRRPLITVEVPVGLTCDCAQEIVTAAFASVLGKTGEAVE